jgi:PIN domain nuclease of toxin-antitoxin system
MKTKLLIDTQIFLWIFIEPHRFTKKARTFFEDQDSRDLYLSDVSAWEASIKFGLNKLRLPEIPEIFFLDRMRQAGFRQLRIDLGHVTRVHSLPQIHRDPFDRLLLSQAKIEEMTIVSSDSIFSRYDVQLLTLSDIS